MIFRNLYMIFYFIIFVASCSTFDSRLMLHEKLKETNEKYLSAFDARYDRLCETQKYLIDYLPNNIINCDTIILFSSWALQESVVFVELWSKVGLYFAENLEDNISIQENLFTYSNFIVNNVLSKNFQAIKEKESEGILLDYFIVDVYLITKTLNNYIIETFSFNEFSAALKRNEDNNKELKQK